MLLNFQKLTFKKERTIVHEQLLRLNDHEQDQGIAVDPVVSSHLMPLSNGSSKLHVNYPHLGILGEPIDVPCHFLSHLS